MGPRILEARTELDKSQDWLAEQMGVDRASISHWENDKFLPRLKRLQHLAEVLEVTTNWLLAETMPKRVSKNNGGVEGKARPGRSPPPDFQDGGRSRRRSDRTISTKNTPLKRA